MSEKLFHFHGNGRARKSIHYDTIESLLREPEFLEMAGDRDFSGWEISPNGTGGRHCLMLILKGGAEWWVIGYLPEKVDLPVWDADAARSAKRQHEAGKTQGDLNGQQ